MFDMDIKIVRFSRWQLWKYLTIGKRIVTHSKLSGCYPVAYSGLTPDTDDIIVEEVDFV